MADDYVPAADGQRFALDSLQSLADFAHACDRLRAGRSYGALAKAARPRPLPAATLSDMINAKTTPTRETVITFLTACGLGAAAQRQWLAAWERIATAHRPQPHGAVRVGQARPRLLGVHASIQTPGAVGDMPPYVPRDFDADLRAALAAAAEEGGFLLLVGSSSVGKTRALYEAVRIGLPEWWLLHPADSPAIAAHAEAPTPRTVVWLDELQRYLNQPDNLAVGTIRKLITSGTVVVATLWPDEYSIRTASRPPAGEFDRYANDRELLGTARILDVSDAFSVAERRRAESMAQDGRIRLALETTDIGFTQVLAAGPQLIRWWENAPANQCYGKALITAALDARRVGASAPLTRQYLAVAAVGYLTPSQQALAPPDWVAQGLRYATTTLNGAACALQPVSSAIGEVAAYVAADYLFQHALSVRRYVQIPQLVWAALVDHHQPEDRSRLIDNARRRCRISEAIAFCKIEAEGGSLEHMLEVPRMLFDQGKVDEGLELGWDLIDEFAELAGVELADLYLEIGDIERAVALLEQFGDDYYDAMHLADLLTQIGRVDEAVDVLRESNIGSSLLSIRVAEVLARSGRIDEAITALQGHIDQGREDAAVAMARILADSGRIDEAITMLQGHVDQGRERAVVATANALASSGQIDKALACIGQHRPQWYDAGHLAAALAGQGRLDEAVTLLRQQADAGDARAGAQLVEFLTEHGFTGELEGEIAAGTIGVAAALARREADRRRAEC